jgi:hypothetical protein
MNPQDAIELLIDAGYTTGWSLIGSELSLWEHDEEPPAPLTRPVQPDAY